MLKLLEDALQIERKVFQHENEIKEFRRDHEALRLTVESLKNPLELLVKDIAEIKITNNAISPMLKKYNFIQLWSIRISLSVTACVIIYALFGSNALKLINLIITAM